MADALLSPEVGLGFCAVSAAAVTYSARRLESSLEQRRVPLMGVLGAFVFAGQMMNFTIPGTGSSGHLIGGVLLATLLGGHAALVTITSVLVIQSLLFADGGILALGANIFNMGVYPCLLGEVMVRAIAGREATGRRLGAGIIIASITCLELGAISVAVETVLSGKSDLRFGQFAALMLAIHLPIGIAEGMVTWAVVRLVYRLQPGLKTALRTEVRPRAILGSHKQTVAAIGISALLLSAVAGWVASTNPDGLQWALAKVAGPRSDSSAQTGVAATLSRVQQQLAVMAGYQLPAAESGPDSRAGRAPGTARASAAGLIGGLISLALVSLAGMLVMTMKRRSRLRRGHKLP